MADLPFHRVKTITRHEWVIGRHAVTPPTARTLTDGIFFAQKHMEDLGLQIVRDDAYHYRVGDEYELILYVDVES